MAKLGDTGREMANEFCLSVSIIPQGLFNVPKNLTTWGQGLYFSSEGRPAMDLYRP
jgi:hypothetical protein